MVKFFTLESGIFEKISGSLARLVESHFDIVGRQLDIAIGEWSPGGNDRATAEVLYLQAQNRMRSGELAEALELLSRSISLAPKFEDAAEGCGEVLDRLGNVAEAGARYEESRRIRRTVRRMPPDRPMVLQRKGRLTTEVATYTWLLRHQEASPFLYVARGNAELALGKPRRALADYSAALGISSDLTSLLALKGEAYAMMGCFDDALLQFNAALAKFPDNPEVWGGRAIVHLACGRLAEADADWRRQHALLPAERVAARACVSMRLADYSVARDELDRARQLNSGDPYWQLYRLAVASRIGEPFVSAPPRSLDEWPGPLVELHAGRISAGGVLGHAGNPERQAEAHYHLGILALGRDLGAARSHFERVLELAPPPMIEYAAAQHELMRWRL